MAELTPKQRAFVREYLVDRNGTQAAIRAGYSKHTAQEQSSRLLSNVMVADAVALADKKTEKRVNVTVDFIVNTLTEIAITESNPAAARVSALRAVGEHIGMWADGKQPPANTEQPETKVPEKEGGDYAWQGDA